MSKVQVDTIDTRSGTSTMQIGSTNTSTINIGVSGDTVNIPSGVTIANAGTATGFGGNNTPAFLVTLSGDQSIPGDTYTKITWDTETFDTAGNFASNKFTPTTSGYYQFNASCRFGTNDDSNFIGLAIYKNGSAVKEGSMVSRTQQTAQVTAIVEANGSGDYFETYFYHDNGGAKNVGAGRWTFFEGFKLIS